MYYQYVLQHVPPLVVEMLIYCKKYFLIKHNKTSESIYKSILINNPIGFDLVYFQKTSIQRFLTLFQRHTLTLYQRCATLKTRRRILVDLQRRTKVISTLIHNVETTLIRH